MKKFLIALISVVLLLSLVGCSANDLNFYKTYRKMITLGSYTFEGETSLVLNFDYDESEAIPDEIIALQAAVSGSKLLYSGSINNENKTLELQLGLEIPDVTTEDSEDTIKIDIINAIAEGEYLYIDKVKLDDSFMIIIGQPLEDTELPEETIDGVVYYKIDMKLMVSAMFDSIEDSILYIEAMPEYPDSISDIYNFGYLDGFYGALFDFELSTTDNEENYDDDYLSSLTPDEVNEYKDGYDTGYSDGMQAAEEEHTQDLAEIESLQQYKTPMLENANAVYLIDAFKDIMLKGNDKMVNDLFDSFDLNLVEKNGDSSYNLHLDNDDIRDVAKRIIGYLADNPDKTVNVIKELLLSFTAEDLIMLGINPNGINKIIEDLELELPYLLDFMDDPDAIDSIFDLMNINLNYDYTINKSGAKAFDVNEVLSFELANEGDETIGFNLSGAITNKLFINKELQGEILTQSSTADISSSNRIRLNTTDNNAKGCGIRCSASQSMSNPTRLNGVKQNDGSYLIDISSLKGGTKYYYQMYSLDSADNIVYSGEILSFTTNSANPPTGDISIVVWPALALGSIVLCCILRKRMLRAC